MIGVANTLLQHAGLPRSVHGIEQCGSLLFSQLYEALTGARPPATTAGGGAGGRESEAERCQAVVDAFSEQLSPHISLDHITGRDLAVRDPLTIINLLDIFSGRNTHSPTHILSLSPQCCFTFLLQRRKPLNQLMTEMTSYLMKVYLSRDLWCFRFPFCRSQHCV